MQIVSFYQAALRRPRDYYEIRNESNLITVEAVKHMKVNVSYLSISMY